MMDFYNSTLLVVTSRHDSEERLSGKQRLVGILLYYVNFVSVGPSISTSLGFFLFSLSIRMLEIFSTEMFSAWMFALSLHCLQKHDPFSFSTSDHVIKLKNISWELKGFGVIWKGFGVGHFGLSLFFLVGSYLREQVPEQKCPPCGASAFWGDIVLWGFC